MGRKLGSSCTWSGKMEGEGGYRSVWQRDQVYVRMEY